MYEFKLPDLGEGIHEGQVVGVLVKEGQRIEAYAPMLEVETDKAAVEIPSPKSGTVANINVEAGQLVHVGDVMLVIDESGDGTAATPAAETKKTTAGAAASGGESPGRVAAAASVGGGSSSGSGASATAVETISSPPPGASPRTNGPIPAAPVVRKLARELGVNINLVTPSGPNGRVLRADVEQFAEGGSTAATGGFSTDVRVEIPSGALPEMDKYGPVRREKLSQIRKTIAKQMTRAWLSVPRVTHSDTADVTEVERHRKQYNTRLGENETKLTMTAILLRVVGAALRRYPMLNCSFDAESQEVVYKDYVHIGIAVDTPRGLVVPVVRDADKKSLPNLAAELGRIGELARTAKFEIADLRGASFTISNVGALGGQFVTPMVNFPETGILGVCRAAWQPKVLDDMTIAPRLMLPFSLSFDHRICDGADAARFVRTVIDAIENPLRLLSL